MNRLMFVQSLTTTNYALHSLLYLVSRLISEYVSCTYERYKFYLIEVVDVGIVNDNSYVVLFEESGCG